LVGSGPLLLEIVTSLAQLQHELVNLLKGLILLLIRPLDVVGHLLQQLLTILNIPLKISLAFLLNERLHFLLASSLDVVQPIPQMFVSLIVVLLALFDFLHELLDDLVELSVEGLVDYF
jgi:hypothetical protein